MFLFNVLKTNGGARFVSKNVFRVDASHLTFISAQCVIMTVIQPLQGVNKVAEDLPCECGPPEQDGWPHGIFLLVDNENTIKRTVNPSVILCKITARETASPKWTFSAKLATIENPSK